MIFEVVEVLKFRFIELKAARFFYCLANIGQKDGQFETFENFVRMSSSSSSYSLHNPETYQQYNLKFDELNSRLAKVKKEFGMRRAISSRSLTGETVIKFCKPFDFFPHLLQLSIVVANICGDS